jgi:hypothetical protein
MFSIAYQHKKPGFQLILERPGFVFYNFESLFKKHYSIVN